MQDQNFNFVKIPINELSTKFGTLVKSKSQVNLWCKGKVPIKHKAKEFQTSANSTLIFFKEDDFKPAKGEKIYYSFKHSGFEYYGVGLAVKSKNEDEFVLQMANEVFRSEKRGKERLLTFPHHQVYSYFEFIGAKDLFRETSNKSNIINLDGFRKPLKEIKREVFTDPVKNFKKTVLDEDDNMMGYRVIDLSSNGIAFLVSAREKMLFDKPLSSRVVLLYNSTTFELISAKIVYVVDSLTGSTKGNPLYKVGMTFDENEKLSDLVHKKLESSNAKEGAQQDFEDFIED
ncbi:MAG: hypothetical protein COW01_10945 [Bdellovibrionales bacterium CG12_big_fil_rev_8_21_14_0_65_38_15]|nr:MAG: hypothetical protein COW79_10355 [Bdellovibrionales bacterium CG22_combo_CG10-13_8_21_14_all_38_13]PIQ54367.1 MAG: hypothetical protein COW01_10945 [Bdellovibrionales bacterium CG12_big_fil_rev_8_21_14_0_65_38_15]PIR28700.1 MAG: hypothetical protein COV38_14260 [Bdellovibrionales bacterium CG11_big_fil_rev_8_21_14_0_20_38_13]